MSMASTYGNNVSKFIYFIDILNHSPANGKQGLAACSPPVPKRSDPAAVAARRVLSPQRRLARHARREPANLSGCTQRLAGWAVGALTELCACLMQRIAYKIATYSVAAPATLYWASSPFSIKLPQKDERPHIAAFPFGASFSLLAFRAHIPIDKFYYCISFN
jgi:hypothetical protein